MTLTDAIRTLGTHPNAEQLNIFCAQFCTVPDTSKVNYSHETLQFANNNVVSLKTKTMYCLVDNQPLTLALNSNQASTIVYNHQTTSFVCPSDFLDEQADDYLQLNTIHYIDSQFQENVNIIPDGIYDWLRTTTFLPNAVKLFKIVFPYLVVSYEFNLYNPETQNYQPLTYDNKALPAKHDYFCFGDIKNVIHFGFDFMTNTGQCYVTHFDKATNQSTVNTLPFHVQDPNVYQQLKTLRQKVLFETQKINNAQA